MSRTLLMEWTKLRTIRAAGWSVLALVGSTVAVSAFAAARAVPTDCAPRPCTLDTARIALAGVYIGQIAVVTIAALAVTAEYETRTIIPTLLAQPGRWRVAAAKAAVVVAIVGVAGAVAVAGCVVVGRLMLARQGFNAGTGDPFVLSWGESAGRRAMVGTVAYLGLVALLSLGVAAIVRGTAASITTVLALLYAVPIAARFVTDPAWRSALARAAPMTAGLAVQSTVGAAPVDPWAGLAVLSAYAAIALVVGAVLFQVRDA
jgi:ABC-2 type transport system permease protein